MQVGAGGGASEPSTAAAAARPPGVRAACRACSCQALLSLMRSDVWCTALPLPFHISCPAPHLPLSPPPQPASPAAELLQAKGLVALALLCRTPTGLACVVSWQGLLPQIERLCARERLQGGGGPGNGAGGGDQYMTAVVTGLTQQMAVNVVPLLHQAAAAARVAWSPRASSGDGGASAALHPLEALLLLLGSVAFRPMVVCDGLITGLADMLAWEVGPGAAAGDPSLRQEVKVRQRLRSVHMHLRSVRVHF